MVTAHREGILKELFNAFYEDYNYPRSGKIRWSKKFVKTDKSILVNLRY